LLSQLELQFCQFRLNTWLLQVAEAVEAVLAATAAAVEVALVVIEPELQLISIQEIHLL
jgi:hypothetical protein